MAVQFDSSLQTGYPGDSRGFDNRMEKVPSGVWVYIQLTIEYRNPEFPEIPYMQSSIFMDQEPELPMCQSIRSMFDGVDVTGSWIKYLPRQQVPLPTHFVESQGTH